MLMNASGNYKRKFKGSDLVRFKDGEDEDTAERPKPTAEDRRRQAIESFKFQKTKFWGKISDDALAELTAGEGKKSK